MQNGKKIFLSALLSTTLFTNFLFGGCSKTEQNINNMLVSNINSSEYFPNTTNKVTQFRLLGAQANEKDINVYGVSELNNNKQAFTTVTYDNYEKKNINLTETKLKQIISSYAIKSIKVKEVPSVITLNNSINKLTTPETPDFYKDKVMVFDITTPIIDEVKGVAVFKTKSYVSTFEIPKNSTSYTKYDNYIVTNQIFVRVSQNELAKFKDQPSLVYKKFTDSVESHQTQLYSVNKINVEPLNNVENNKDFEDLSQ